jgi:hypothetical protein
MRSFVLFKSRRLRVGFLAEGEKALVAARGGRSEGTVDEQRETRILGRLTRMSFGGVKTWRG